MINEESVEKYFNDLLNVLSKIEQNNNEIDNVKLKKFLDFLLEIKKNLLNKKIYLELNSDNSSDIYIEINEYIKIITEIEGKYKNLFFNKINKYIITSITKDIMLDKAFIKKIINLKDKSE